MARDLAVRRWLGSSRRHGIVVESKTRKELKMKTRFEPSHNGLEAWVRAYEQAVPSVRRPIAGREPGSPSNESTVISTSYRRQRGGCP